MNWQLAEAKNRFSEVVRRASLDGLDLERDKSPMRVDFMPDRLI